MNPLRTRLVTASAIFTLSLISFAGFATNTTYYSLQSGDANASANWNTARDGSGTNHSGIFKSSGDKFIVQDGHALTTSATWDLGAADQVLKIEAGGTLQANHLVLLKSGTSNGVFEIQNGGTYIHNYDNATSPSGGIFAGNEIFGASSNFKILNWNASSLTTQLSLPYGNLEINLPASYNSNWNQSWSGTINLCSGNLSIGSVGSGTFRFATNSSPTIMIDGNYTQTSGAVDLCNASSGAQNVILQVKGNFTKSGGTITASGSNAVGTINFSGGAQQIRCNQSDKIVFSVNAGSSCALSGDFYIGALFQVAALGVLDCGSDFLIKGTGPNAKFTLSGDGKIITANSNGIGSSGSIQTTLTNFSSAGIYEFQGSGTGVFTTMGTANTVGKMIVNNAGGVTLNQNLTITNTLDFQDGLLFTGSNILTIGESGNIANAGSTRYVNGKMAQVYTGLDSKTFPIGKDGECLPVILSYTAVSGTSTVVAEAFNGNFPGNIPSGITQVGSRYWALTQTGGSNINCDIKLDGSGLSFTNESKILQHDGGTTTVHSAAEPDYTVSGLTSLGSFALGEVACTVPPTPAISADGPVQICLIGNVTFTSSSASGNQWYKDGSPMTGATSQTYVASTTGNYHVVVSDNSCVSQASNTLTVSVAENTPPILSGCPDDASYSCLGDVPPPAIVTATDECLGTITPGFSEMQSNSGSGCNKTITRTWTATDGINQVSCTQVITVQMPDFVMPGNSGSTVSCAAEIAAPTLPLVSDHCGNILTPTGPVISSVPSCDGAVNYTYNYSDCADHAHDWVYTYILKRDAVPGIPANGASTVQCVADAVVPNAPDDVVDQCGNLITGVLTHVTPDPGCNGTKTYSFTFTDCAGLQATWDYVYTIYDNTPPVISNCPTDVTVYTGAASVSCGHTAIWTEPTANDNCGGALSYSYRSHAPGSSFPVGNTTVYYVFKDCSGNSSSCSFTVTVFDNTVPTLTPIQDVDEPIGANCGFYLPDYTTLTTAFDNCGNATVSQSPAIGTLINGHNTTELVTLTADDGHGNTATTSFTVTLKDLLKPDLTAGTYSPVCADAAPVLLSGSPYGGVWTGNGVSWNQQSGYSFSPVSGSQELSYVYTNANGCSYTAQASIDVNLLPNAPSPASVNQVYDGTTYVGTAQAGNDEFIVWYDAAIGGNVTAAPSRSAVGTATAYATAKQIKTGCESSSRTEVSVTITPKILHASLVGSVSKTYDGSTIATLASGNYSLSGVVNLNGLDDDVRLSNAGTGYYDTKHQGTNKNVSVSGLALTGNDAANYQLASATIAALIGEVKPKNITGSFTVEHKEYNRSTNATIASFGLIGVLPGDVQNLSVTGSVASFYNPDAGIGKPVKMTGCILSGIEKDNYFLTSVADASADINPRPLNFTGTRVYDNSNVFDASALIAGNLLQGDATTLAGIATVSHADVGTYTAFTSNGLSSSNPNYKVDGGTVVISITAADGVPEGQVYYTGSEFFWTNNPNSSVATLILSATVKNKDFGSGDITTARVSFFVRDGSGMTPISGAQNLPVGLVYPGNHNIGTASAVVQHNIGSAVNYADLEIAVKVSGNYKNNWSNPCHDGHVGIAKPSATGELTGSGWMDNANAAGQLSGMLNADKCFYRFDVTYNKNMKTVNGKVEIIISPTAWDPVTGEPTEQYRIRSTSVTALGITGCVADFTAKCNVTKQFFNPALNNGHGGWDETGIEGGATIQVVAEDYTLACPNGTFNAALSPDKVGVTVFRKSGGGIWYSNNWGNTQTVRKAIYKGHLATGCQGLPSARLTAHPSSVAENVNVYPNPTSGSFFIDVPSPEETSEVSVTDLQGRLVFKAHFVAGQTQVAIRLENAASGLYIVEMKNGESMYRTKVLLN